LARGFGAAFFSLREKSKPAFDAKLYTLLLTPYRKKSYARGSSLESCWSDEAKLLFGTAPNECQCWKRNCRDALAESGQTTNGGGLSRFGFGLIEHQFTVAMLLT
jgi:hypothetical protein